jgi:hypothetical protein
MSRLGNVIGVPVAGFIVDDSCAWQEIATAVAATHKSTFSSFFMIRSKYNIDLFIHLIIYSLQTAKRIGFEEPYPRD